MEVLTVNAGSTSVKVATIVDGEATTTWASLDDALGGTPPDCVAHRVVHGGDRTDGVVLDDAVVDGLRTLCDLAPLHQPPALDAIDRCRAAWPDVAHVACFDTAFHASIPAAARTYALPDRYRRTIRQYGFHGLSHQWATRRVAMLAPDAHRVLVAHLGGGGSLCAVRDGRSAMTTMGFTPLDGLVMGTRCGTIDPGALLWIRRHHPDDDLERALDEESGLLGLCGTADLREVHARVDAGDGDAVLAFGVWRHRLLTLAGACITALGGVDAIAFTGGIGEHDHRARTTLCDGLAWAGIRLDDERSRAADGDGEITGPTSTARLFVIRSREDLMLAEGAASVLAG